MKVMGVDPSIRSTGFCISNAQAWSLTFKGLKGEPSGDLRLALIRNEIMAQLANGIELVVAESLPPYGKGSAALGLVHGVLREACARQDVKLVYLAPTSLKKFATGDGKAGKSDMRKAMLAVTYQEDWNNDAIDAWWLRQVGLAYLGYPHFGITECLYDVKRHIKEV